MVEKCPTQAQSVLQEKIKINRSQLIYLANESNNS